MTTTMTSVPATSGLLRIRRLAAGAALGALGALLVGPVIVAVATKCALAGDLLGVIGRLTQLAAVVSQGQQRPDVQTLVLDLLQATFNAGGFVLVAISFTAFGVLFIRNRSRRLGAVANVFFLAWYITLGVTFRRTEASS